MHKHKNGNPPKNEEENEESEGSFLNKSIGDEDTEENEEFEECPSQTDSIFTLAMRSLEKAITIVSRNFNELKPTQLAQIAKKFITENESAAKLPQLKPRKILLHTANTDRNSLQEVRSVFKANQYLSILLWTSAKKAYEKSKKNKDQAIALFQSNTFLLLPTLLLKEIIDKYEGDDDFNAIRSSKFEYFSLSLERIKKIRGTYEEACLDVSKARALLLSSRLELDLAPRHIAKLILFHCNIQAFKIIEWRGKMQYFSRMDLEFFLIILKSKKIVAAISAKEIFNLQMAHIANPAYKQNLIEGKIESFGYVSAIIDRAFRGNDNNIIAEFLSDRHKNEDLKEILKLEAKWMMSLEQHSLQTLFQRSYLPFTASGIAKLLNNFCNNNVFFSIIVVWLAKNMDRLSLDIDAEIINYSLKNKRLAQLISTGMMRTILKEQTIEEIKEQYPDIEIAVIPQPIEQTVIYHELNSNDRMIKKTLKFEEEIVAAKAGMFDYMALAQEGAVGISEERNKRETQEDQISMGSILYFDDLKEKDQKSSILEAFPELQARYGNKPTEGACAIAAIVTTSGLVTINLGDSYAFLVTCNGKKSKTEQLNKVLHKPNILEEQKRLEKFHQEKIQGGASDWLEYVTQDYSRLKASYSNGLVIEDGFKLSLTGAFGDTDHENSGLRHDPDVYFHSYEDIYKDIEDAEGACLIITCDGVMEKSNDAKWIGAMVAANSEKSPDEIAKALTEQAKKNGSHDNISIVVVKLKALLKQDQRQMNECSYFIVCDGHGGGQIAEEVCKHFGEVLSEKVNQKRQEVARSGKRRREEESKSQEEKENEEPKNKLSRTDETVKTNEKNGKPSSPENPGANRYAQWGSPPSSPMNSDDEDEENEEKEKKEEEEQEEEEVTFNLSLGFSNFTG